MPVFLKYFLLMLCLALLPQRQALAVPEEPISDIRVLIDVSGSMKKNDPENLRAPALRMLVGLMPEDAKSGVWTFARYVNMLVSWQDVNDAWRKSAEKNSEKIHSYGLFTNIEQALQKATANQKQPDPAYRRSLILLSDGFVDIEPDKASSQASRQRILDKLVPRLKQANIAVHTIALSEHADHELLRALSLATDGWYQQAETADDLQRIFLHLFEKAAQRDTVPLQDNQFSIDGSVSEMTVLVFREPGSAAATLHLPDGKVLTQKDQANNIRWLHENSYDLITIEQPVDGGWKIDAALDPDNRVMVVTDMKLQTSDLPNNVLIGEKFDFEASLTDKGQTITRPAFLDLVDASLQQDVEDQKTYREELQRDDKKGLYRATLGSAFMPGRNDVIVTMKSATFERQRRQSINVVAMPISVATEQLDQQTRGHRIQVQADTKLIKPESLTITALLKEETGSEWPYDMLKTDANNWRLTLTDLQPQQEYELSLQIRGETQKGRQIFLQPEPIVLQDNKPPMPPVDEPDQAITESPIEAVETEQTQTTETMVETADELISMDEVSDEKTDNGMSSTVKLLIGNGIILILLAAGVFWWRRQSTTLVAAGDLI
ncbi:VWA domain-containing protein [Methylophaga sp. OBS4]|uniref:VWA domain-containing protein n=1 Tax=Methylophaga sp. OBS4 TaxID=2991935 RepID=UPI0022562B92|nr:vWA domain-containing protein [Methylophaga sp. OBS4]MCX4187716.1 VWA domain-containing protein [Methylophaga sp. OBS4]MCX4187765.1 VWA domain-containing protein [Methylophaga sp. OBS4]